MENLLSFLTVRLKLKGMTVNEFCKKIGISRQKFYRFVKEPRRFPPESVRSMISVLSLDKADVRQLASYLDPQERSGSGSEEPGSSPPDLTVYRDLIENLFRHRMSAELAPDLDSVEFIQAGKNVTFVSPASLAQALAGSSDSAGLSGSSHGPAAREHEFEILLYNCVPDPAAPTARQVSASAKAIRIIASIVNELENALLPSSPVRVRILHYTTKERIREMKSPDLHDRQAMSFQLRLLDAVLPLLSMAEDYRLETGEDSDNAWAPKGDVCTIKHVCRRLPETVPLPETIPLPEGSSLPDKTTQIEYYVLLFSENGGCRACRLGSDEVRHIYRFLSPDSTGTYDFTGNPVIKNPSLELYEKYKDCPIITLYPNLYFDNIPPRMWAVLFDEIQNNSDRELYERAFRKLIDPYGQYTFLDFENLVRAVLKTMEQRTETAARMGHCVICHPNGLLDMVRTGMISDLMAISGICPEISRPPAPLRFPVPLIRELLEMIRSGILRRQTAGITDPTKCDWVNYYILNPQFPVPEIAFHLYGGRGVMPLYTKGRHKHVLTGLFDSPAAAAILFDYVKEEMIGKRGEKLNAAIMSDEHSLSLLDKLISMTDEGEPL